MQSKIRRAAFGGGLSTTTKNIEGFARLSAILGPVMRNLIDHCFCELDIERLRRGVSPFSSDWLFVPAQVRLREGGQSEATVVLLAPDRVNSGVRAYAPAGSFSVVCGSG